MTQEAKPTKPHPSKDQLSKDERSTDQTGAARSARRSRKTLKPLSPDYFRRAALYYLERYGGASHGVRQLLQRRIRRAQMEGQELDLEAVQGWIDMLIADLERNGLINDASFTLTRARRLQAQGQSRAMMRQKLAAKGLAKQDIDQALQRLDEELDDNAADPDLDAARAYVRKRRLGWMRGDEDERNSFYSKDLAALGRRGFSYDIARKALEEPDDTQPWID